MTFCDFLLNEKSSTWRTSECVSYYNTSIDLCVCVYAVSLELFDVNKLCHCFVRPLSPKQHIISLLHGLYFLSVGFCLYSFTTPVYIHFYVVICGYVAE